MTEFKIKLDTAEIIETVNKEFKEKALRQAKEMVYSLVIPKNNYVDGKLVVTKSYVQTMVEQEIDAYATSGEFSRLIKDAIEKNMPVAIESAAKRYCDHVASKAAFSLSASSKKSC